MLKWIVDFTKAVLWNLIWARLMTFRFNLLGFLVKRFSRCSRLCNNFFVPKLSLGSTLRVGYRLTVSPAKLAHVCTHRFSRDRKLGAVYKRRFFVMLLLSSSNIQIFKKFKFHVTKFHVLQTCVNFYRFLKNRIGSKISFHQNVLIRPKRRHKILIPNHIFWI